MQSDPKAKQPDPAVTVHLRVLEGKNWRRGTWKEVGDLTGIVAVNNNVYLYPTPEQLSILQNLDKAGHNHCSILVSDGAEVLPEKFANGKEVETTLFLVGDRIHLQV